MLVRLGLVAFGLVLAFAALELFLRAGAAYQRDAVQTAVPVLQRGARRIACVGDSNTFGIGMPRDKTYPAFLQQLLAGDEGTAPVTVLNLGVPGTNSSSLRQRLGEVIDTFQPDLLLVMVGANDFWTVPVAGSDAGEPTWRQRLWAHSRAYRFVYMIARALQQRREQPAVEMRTAQGVGGRLRYGGAAIDLASPGRAQQNEWRQGLFDDLRAIVDAARRREVDVVLLTYPSEGKAYGQANAVIRGAATGTPLIDLGRAFQDACSGGVCPELFLPDLHPNVEGYQLAATLVWRSLRQRQGTAAAGHDGPSGSPFPGTVDYLRRIDALAATRPASDAPSVWAPPARTSPSDPNQP